MVVVATGPEKLVRILKKYRSNLLLINLDTQLRDNSQTQKNFRNTAQSRQQVPDCTIVL